MAVRRRRGSCHRRSRHRWLWVEMVLAAPILGIHPRGPRTMCHRRNRLSGWRIELCVVVQPLCSPAHSSEGLLPPDHRVGTEGGSQRKSRKPFLEHVAGDRRRDGLQHLLVLLDDDLWRGTTSPNLGDDARHARCHPPRCLLRAIYDLGLFPWFRRSLLHSH